MVVMFSLNFTAATLSYVSKYSYCSKFCNRPVASNKPNNEGVKDITKELVPHRVLLNSISTRLRAQTQIHINEWQILVLSVCL